MATATVTRRALLFARFYDVSTRVCTVSSTLISTRNYENETWHKRWWLNARRNISVSARLFEPNLSSTLMKHVNESKKATGVTVVYQGGLPKITVPLQSRQERCEFTLKPITNTVGDFLTMLKNEDPGIDRAIVTTIDDIRIAKSNSIEHLLQSGFKLIINDIAYTVHPPLRYGSTMEQTKQLSHVHELTVQLYEAFYVQEHHAELEKYVLAELEATRLELLPYEEKLRDLLKAADKRAKLNTWGLLVLMSMYFGILARLTWWEYSWDIMEPITYFFTYGTAVGYFIYYVVTKEEYLIQQAIDRRRLKEIYKRARRIGLNIEEYNRLKDRAYELENALWNIRGPIFDTKMEMQRKKHRCDSSSSSSSRSPSSSPSPSPSPSPERDVSRRPVYSKQKDDKFS